MTFKYPFQLKQFYEYDTTIACCSTVPSSVAPNWSGVILQISQLVADIIPTTFASPSSALAASPVFGLSTSNTRHWHRHHHKGAGSPQITPGSSCAPGWALRCKRDLAKEMTWWAAAGIWLARGLNLVGFISLTVLTMMDVKKTKTWRN